VRKTPIWQFAMRPAVPRYWRFTPTDLVPCLRTPVSSLTRVASGFHDRRLEVVTHGIGIPCGASLHPLGPRFASPFGPLPAVLAFDRAAHPFHIRPHPLALLGPGKPGSDACLQRISFSRPSDDINMPWLILCHDRPPCGFRSLWHIPTLPATVILTELDMKNLTNQAKEHVSTPHFVMPMREGLDRVLWVVLNNTDSMQYQVRLCTNNRQITAVRYLNLSAGRMLCAMGMTIGNKSAKLDSPKDWRGPWWGRSSHAQYRGSVANVATSRSQTPMAHQRTHRL
jgi:hypothetical protein